MSCDLRSDCGCSCNVGNAPCHHCVEDHNNIDNHPRCEECMEILYDANELDILRHNVLEFKLR
jgi:hypothetical protein